MSEFSPLWGGNEGEGELLRRSKRSRPGAYGACDDEEQEKALALLCARAVTSARSAGGFRGRGLTLFRVAKTAIDAIFGKTGEYPRR